MKKVGICLIVGIMMTACMQPSRRTHEVQPHTYWDSLFLDYQNRVYGEQERQIPLLFGKEMSEDRYEMYTKRILSKREVDNWLLHAEAVHGMIIEGEDRQKFKNIRWTQFGLDTLEYKFQVMSDIMKSTPR